MRVKCVHGFFIFDETGAGQIADWMSLTGLSIAPWGDYYTFKDLIDAPDFSLAGAPLLGIPAIETFEGKPWEVFEANGFVYDFTLGLVRPIASVTMATEITQAGKFFVSPGLLLPGSVTAEGKVKDFSGWYSRQRQTWHYSEVTYV